MKKQHGFYREKRGRVLAAAALSMALLCGMGMSVCAEEVWDLSRH